MVYPYGSFTAALRATLNAQRDSTAEQEQPDKDSKGHLRS